MLYQYMQMHLGFKYLNHWKDPSYYNYTNLLLFMAFVQLPAIIFHPELPAITTKDDKVTHDLNTLYSNEMHNHALWACINEWRNNTNKSDQFKEFNPDNSVKSVFVVK